MNHLLATWLTFHVGYWQTIVLLVAVGVLVPYFIFTYRSERAPLRPLQRMTLIALRLLIFTAVLWMIARPSSVMTETETHKPVLPMVIDESRSMNYPDARGDVLTETNPREHRHRFDAAVAAVNELNAKLDQTHEVRAYLFSDVLRRLPQVQDVATTQPASDYTHIGDALCDLMADLSDRKPPAIILATDGRQTGGRAVKEAIAMAQAAKIPIDTVMLGDEFPLRDLRIDDVSAPPEVSLGDVLAINVAVTNQISEPLNVTANLLLGDKVIADKALTLKRGSSRFTLYCIPDQVGEYDFRIVLPPQEDEVDLTNNEAQIHISVTKHSLRTLLVAGMPNLEYHYMVPALLRDPVINLSTFLQWKDVDYVQQGKESITDLPKTSLEWEKYDVIILYDVDPNKLTSAQVTGIEHAVSKGRGLMFIAGRNFGLAKLIQLQGPKIRAMLPVDVEVKAPPDTDQLFDKPFVAWRTPQGKVHPIMMCESRTDLNDKIWQTFPEIYWYQPVIGVKPGAVALLVAGDKQTADQNGSGQPLMAVQRYGEGAVFYCGTNAMWYWRYPYGSYDYDRFWSRAIRYLGESRLTGKQEQVALGTDKRIYAPGERAKVKLELLDPALATQLTDAPIYCNAKDPGGGEFMMRMTPVKDAVGIYTAEYPAVQPGQTTLRCRQAAPGADTEAKPLFDVSQTITVKVRSEEEIDTSGDMETLKSIAAQTGGHFYCYKNMRDLASLPALIPATPEVLVRHRSEEVWDTGWLLGVILALAGAEWSLRKWWGLL